jgi:hypothetical protein
MAEIREPDLVRREIALERDQLAGSIERLRAEMLDARGRLRMRVKAVAAMVALVVVALASLRAVIGVVAARLRR